MEDANVVIRTAAERDIPSILDIINDEIMNSSAIYDYEPKTLQEQQDWYDHKMKKQFPVIVSAEGGTVTGFGTYSSFREKAGYRKTVEHSVYIHKSYRGKGIGGMIMTELISRARQKGMHTIIAGVDSANTGSLEFHKKFGFEEVGRFKEVGYKFDRWLDVVFMQLILE